MQYSLAKRTLLIAIPLALLFTPAALVGAAGGLDVCLPVCSVPSTANGYATPVTVVASGSTLQWTTLDGQYHTATSADYALDARIFEAGVESGPGEATFEIRSDGLWVRTEEPEAEQPPEFELAYSAIDVGGGAFVLQYQCLFHTRFQQGAIIVTPGASATE